LAFFENNFTAEWLKASALADPNMGNLVQGEHPKIRVEQGWGHSGAQKTCNISKTVHDRTKVTITD